MVRNTRRTFLKAGTVAAIGATGLAGCIGDGQEIPTIDLGWVVPLENTVSLLDSDELREELDNLGEVYEFGTHPQAGTPDGVSAMAAEELDITLVTTVSFASAALEEPVPGGITLVAMDFYDAHPDQYGFEIFAHPDSGIEEPEDLEGADLGINQVGTGTHAIYNLMLEQVGIDPEEDVNFVELEFPAHTEALKDGRFDVSIYPAFFAPIARQEEFVEVFSSHDAWGQMYPFAYLAARNDFIDEQQDALEAFLEDYDFLLDYIFENRSETISIAADLFDLDEDVVDAWYLTEYDFYREDPEVDLDGLQFAMDEIHRLGFTDDEFDVNDFASNDYLP